MKKRGAAGGDRAGKKPAKKGKAEKDPNKPKRPASAFFVFMYELLTKNSICVRSLCIYLYISEEVYTDGYFYEILLNKGRILGRRTKRSIQITNLSPL